MIAAVVVVVEVEIATLGVLVQWVHTLFIFLIAFWRETQSFNWVELVLQPPTFKISLCFRLVLEVYQKYWLPISTLVQVVVDLFCRTLHNPLHPTTQRIQVPTLCVWFYMCCLEWQKKCYELHTFISATIFASCFSLWWHITEKR